MVNANFAAQPPFRDDCGKKLPYERQKKMVALLVAGEKLTSRRCEQEFGITRDTATRDFSLLLELGLATRQGRGRSTSYVLASKK